MHTISGTSGVSEENGHSFNVSGELYMSYMEKDLYVKRSAKQNHTPCNEGLSTENKQVSVNRPKANSGSDEPTAISEKESNEVFHFKFIVISVLLLVVIIVTPWVFSYTTNSEQDKFVQKFNSDASKILEAVRISIDNSLMPMDALALALVSHAKDHNNTWPFVTIPDYGARVAKVLPSAHSNWISVLPVVTPAERQQWENYSRTHDSWVEESFSIQNKWHHYHGPKNISFDHGPSERISGNFGPLEESIRCVYLDYSHCLLIYVFMTKSNTHLHIYSRIMLPQWQTFPSVPVVRITTLIIF